MTGGSTTRVVDDVVHRPVLVEQRPHQIIGRLAVGEVATYAVALPPSASIPAATRSSSSASRDQQHHRTATPSARAVASPIPDEAPVTSTVRPASGLDSSPRRRRTARARRAFGVHSSRLMRGR